MLVEVRDDGAGMDVNKLKRSAVERIASEPEVQVMSDREALDIIFIPGFSTSKIATEVSCRVSGHGCSQTNLERVNGRVEVRTEFRKGTAFTLRLPLH